MAQGPYENKKTRLEGITYNLTHFEGIRKEMDEKKGEPVTSQGGWGRRESKKAN